MGMKEEDFKKLSLAERVKRLEYEIEVLVGDDMRSISYAQSLNDKAQDGVEIMEQMYQPLVLHAEHMSKKLTEKIDELRSAEMILDILENQLKKQKAEEEVA